MPPARDRVAAALAGTGAALICLLVVAATPSDGFWIVDCGSRALLTERLLDTRFRDLGLGNPAGAFDPEGSAFPAQPPFVVRRGDGFVSAYPPAYAALAVPFRALLGRAGLRVPAVLGLAACTALFVGWLAPVIGRHRALAAGLVLAFATPLFFYGVTVWEHALVAALALGAWRLADRQRWSGAGAVLGAACWLREELVLMAVALALVGGLRERRIPPLVRLAAGAAPPLLALGLFNQSVYGTPFGAHVGLNLDPGVALSRPASEIARQAGAVLVGAGESPRETLLLASLLVAPVFGWIAARHRPGVAWLPLAAGALVCAFALFRTLRADAPLEPLVAYNGVLIRLPLACAAGIGLAALRAPALAPLRLGVATGLVFTVLALIAGLLSHTQFGYGVQWGPRELVPAYPAFVALFAAAFCAGPGRPTGWALRAAGALVVAAGLVSSVQASWLLHQQKTDAVRLQAAILSFPQPVAVTGHPFLALHLAPLWERKPMLRAADTAALDHLAARLRAAGLRELLLLAPVGTPALSTPGGVRCRLAARPRGELGYLDLDLQVCRLF